MEYWGFCVILIVVLSLIVKLTQVCRDVGSKDEHPEVTEQNLTNIYLIEEDFFVVDNENAIHVSNSALPSYLEACNSAPPPPYDPPPAYTQVEIKESPQQ
jgi:hypothetical protein